MMHYEIRKATSAEDKSKSTFTFDPCVNKALPEYYIAGETGESGVLFPWIIADHIRSGMEIAYQDGRQDGVDSFAEIVAESMAYILSALESGHVQEVQNALRIRLVETGRIPPNKETL